MTRFLLDTNVVSEFRRTAPSPKVLAWLGSSDQEALYLSVVTLGEIRRGIERTGDSTKKRTLNAWLALTVRPQFGDRILPIDERVAGRWGSMLGTAARRGHPIPPIDAFLAATALEHDMTLVTRNARDFAGTGVTLLNPWEFE